MRKNKYKSITSMVLAAITSIPTHARVSIEVFCLTSGDQSPIELELREYTDTNLLLTSAFVKYRKSSTWIPLVLEKTRSVALAPDTVDELTVSWLEFNKRRITGVYEMTSQGTLVSSMIYTNAATKKTYSFTHDLGIDFSAEKGCAWGK